MCASAYGGDSELPPARATWASLPNEVIVDYIAKFLSGADLRCLAHTCCRLLSLLRCVRLYRLWPLYNWRYLDDPSFRAEVCAVIPVSRLVLYGDHIDCDDPFDDNLPAIPLHRWPRTGLAPFAGVHTAVPSVAVGDARFLRGVHTVRIRAERRIDLLSLREARSIDITFDPTDDTPKNWSVLVGARRLCVTHANPDFAKLSALRRVSLAGFNVVTVAGLERCVSVRLKGTRVADIAPLAHVRSVSLDDCQHVRDFSVLVGVRNLEVTSYDGRCLGAVPQKWARVHRLNLTECTHLADVSGAGHVHTLILRHCRKVNDVSALGGVHVLDVTGCGEGGLVGIESLAGAYTLILGHHPVSTKVAECLGGVHALSLAYDGDPRVFACVHALTLRSDTLQDASALAGVAVLDLSGCQRLTRVSALGRCRFLRLSRTPVRDVSALGHVHTLFLDHCWNLTDMSALSAVHTLDLSMTGVTDVSSLGRVHRLSLQRTPVADVSALSSVHWLNLAYCDRVRDVSALGRVHTLILAGTRVSDVSALGGVSVLSLRNCDQIVDISALGRVCVLDIRRCGRNNAESSLAVPAGVRKLIKVVY